MGKLKVEPFVLSKEEPTTTLEKTAEVGLISDDDIARYADIVIRGELEVEDALRKVFGFLPTPAQIVEIEASRVYREAIDTLTLTLQSQLKVNATGLARFALEEVQKTLLQNSRIRDDMYQKYDNGDKVKIADWAMVNKITLDTFKVVKDELGKAIEALAKANNEDEHQAVWEEVLND